MKLVENAEGRNDRYLLYYLLERKVMNVKMNKCKVSVLTVSYRKKEIVDKTRRDT
jgi:hypothetical protein